MSQVDDEQALRKQVNQYLKGVLPSDKYGYPPSILGYWRADGRGKALAQLGADAMPIIVQFIEEKVWSSVSGICVTEQGEILQSLFIALELAPWPGIDETLMAFARKADVEVAVWSMRVLAARPNASQWVDLRLYSLASEYNLGALRGKILTLLIFFRRTNTHLFSKLARQADPLSKQKK
jgi:hypothetical protein